MGEGKVSSTPFLLLCSKNNWEGPSFPHLSNNILMILSQNLTSSSVLQLTDTCNLQKNLTLTIKGISTQCKGKISTACPIFSLKAQRPIKKQYPAFYLFKVFGYLVYIQYEFTRIMNDTQNRKNRKYVLIFLWKPQDQKKSVFIFTV